jgi:NADH-quinone oxidoreductase subunit K
MTLAMMMTLAFLIFCIGVAGVLVRRDPIIMFICIEMMFNAANLAFVAIARATGLIEAQAIAVLVIAVAAAEVAVGLAIIIAIFRGQHEVDVDHVSSLKG